MTIILIFALLFFGFTALLWGGTLIVQGYLYSEPAERLGLRATISGAALALFFAFWALLDQQTPGYYGHFFAFESQERTELDGFTAEREFATGTTKNVEYAVRRAGPGSRTYLGPDGKPFTPRSTDWLVKALLVKVNEGDEGPVRFEAEMDDGAFAEPLRYTEVDGDRFIEGGSIGILTDPQPGRVVINLLLNLLHFVLWFGLICFVMEYHYGHALLMTFFLGLIGMLVILPVLFAQNAPIG